MDSEIIFTVTGTDDEGDRHTFETVDEERAQAMLAQFREDLPEVSIAELRVTVPGDLPA